MAGALIILQFIEQMTQCSLLLREEPAVSIYRALCLACTWISPLDQGVRKKKQKLTTEWTSIVQFTMESVAWTWKLSSTGEIIAE